MREELRDLPVREPMGERSAEDLRLTAVTLEIGQDALERQIGDIRGLAVSDSVVVDDLPAVVCDRLSLLSAGLG